jgi:N-acetylneuraminate lyase
MTDFSGIWPALVTPFTAENTINTDTVVRLVRYHLKKGVNGFYVCGSTGSGVFLSVAERKQMVEAVSSTVSGQVPLIVHVGAVSLQDAIDLAHHAQAQGAAGFSSIIPPLYSGFDNIFKYYKALAEAAPTLSFFPYIAHPEINALDLVHKLVSLPNVVGVKYTGPNMFEFRRIATLRDENWHAFSGMDEQSIFAAMMGSCGHIGSTLNYMPGVYSQIRKHLAEGEHEQALALQLAANAVTEQMLAAGFTGALYAALALMGFDCGQPRLPGVPLCDDEKKRLRANLDAVGFWELTEMA